MIQNARNSKGGVASVSEMLLDLGESANALRHPPRGVPGSVQDPKTTGDGKRKKRGGIIRILERERGQEKIIY